MFRLNCSKELEKLVGRSLNLEFMEFQYVFGGFGGSLILIGERNECQR